MVLVRRAIVALSFLLFSCANDPPKVTPSRPSEARLQRIRHESKQECLEEFFFWGSLQEVADLLEETQDETVPATVEAVGSVYAEVHDFGLTDPEDPRFHAQVGGCQGGFAEALERMTQIRARGWGRWGTRERWISYVNYFFLCRSRTEREGIYVWAEDIGLIRVTPEAIARHVESEVGIAVAGATYEGCRKGIYEGLALRDLQTE